MPILLILLAVVGIGVAVSASGGSNNEAIANKMVDNLRSSAKDVAGRFQLYTYNRNNGSVSLITANDDKAVVIGVAGTLGDNWLLIDKAKI